MLTENEIRQRLKAEYKALKTSNSITLQIKHMGAIGALEEVLDKKMSVSQLYRWLESEE